MRTELSLFSAAYATYTLARWLFALPGALDDAVAHLGVQAPILAA